MVFRNGFLLARAYRTFIAGILTREMDTVGLIPPEKKITL